HTLRPGQSALEVQPRAASALFVSPSAVSAIPARPTPNFFNAPRRVTDWARPLASSSNLSFIIFLVFALFRISGFTLCYRKLASGLQEILENLGAPTKRGLGNLNRWSQRNGSRSGEIANGNFRPD